MQALWQARTPRQQFEHMGVTICHLIRDNEICRSRQ